MKVYTIVIRSCNCGMSFPIKDEIFTFQEKEVMERSLENIKANMIKWFGDKGESVLIETYETELLTEVI